MSCRLKSLENVLSFSELQTENSMIYGRCYPNVLQEVPHMCGSWMWQQVIASEHKRRRCLIKNVLLGNHQSDFFRQHVTGYLFSKNLHIAFNLKHRLSL